MSYKILVTRRIPDKAIRLLQSNIKGVEIYDSDDAIPKEKLVSFFQAGIDGLFCLLTDNIDKEILNAAGVRLRVISTMSVGLDHIDLNECKSKQIRVGYTPDVLTNATAEFAVSLLLSTTRRIVEGTHAVKNGHWGTWKPMWMCGPSLNGSTVGIVGLGRIGKQVIKLLTSFGVSKFLYTSRSPKPDSESCGAEYCEMSDVLKRSDFVICACSLTPETKEMFSHRQFADMKHTSVFINISRGGVVDQEALYVALKKGEIAMAGLDVTTPEPLPKDHPLLTLPNCIVTPHIASASIQTRESMAMLAAQNLINGLNNKDMPAELDLLI